MVKKFVCSSTAPIVQIKAGSLRGYCLDGTYTFHGIQYADAARFGMPTPVKAWDGVKDALSYGYVAPLVQDIHPFLELLAPHRYWPQDEHCQYLNIWTQSLEPNAKMPVMVWLHGGAFSEGSSIEMVAYDGESLSKYGDVVVVTLNHRLNIIGYLDLSDFGDKYYNSGNAGMADIVEALKWIQENIAAFGGDPDNVTVFGQSGGGLKATALCQIPSAAGLFHKAIVMSGAVDISFGLRRDDKAIVEAMLWELGLSPKDIEKFETLPYGQLAGAYNKIAKKLQQEQNIQVLSTPIPNGWYLGNPLEVGFSENAKKIPTMVGAVFAEFAFGPKIPAKNELSPHARRDLIFGRFGNDADELIRLFKRAYPDKNEVDLLQIDTYFRIPTLQYLEMKSAVSEAPVYSYMFTPEFDFGDGKPAWHCSDIPFVFHNSQKVAICNACKSPEMLEEQIYGAYVHFARTGNPNHLALPQWPRFMPDHKATMVFDDTCEVRVDYDRELMELLSKHSVSLLSLMNRG